jgi:hypothetical protein
MKRTDISENFYTKDRTSTKGKKKSFIQENDTLVRKKKIAFKNYIKNLQEEDDSFYSEYDD